MDTLIWTLIRSLATEVYDRFESLYGKLAPDWWGYPLRLLLDAC